DSDPALGRLGTRGETQVSNGLCPNDREPKSRSGRLVPGHAAAIPLWTSTSWHFAQRGHSIITLARENAAASGHGPWLHLQSLAETDARELHRYFLQPLPIAPSARAGNGSNVGSHKSERFSVAPRHALNLAQIGDINFGIPPVSGQRAVNSHRAAFQ